MGHRMLSWVRFVVGLLGLLFAFSPAVAHAQTTPPVYVSFTAAPDPAQPGDSVVYKVVLANPSATTPTGAFQLNVSPSQYETITYFDGGSCTTNPCRFGSTAYWSVATIPAGASTAFQFTAVVDNTTTYPAPSAGTVLTTTLSATVATKAVTASTSVTIGAHPMNLAFTTGPTRVLPGGLQTYTLSYGNAGTSSVPTTLSVSVPTGASFVSATGGGTLSGSTVLWDLGTVASGAVDQRQFTIKVADATPPGTLLIVQGQLLNSSNQQSLVRESNTTLVGTSSLLSLSLTGSPDPAQPGSTVVYKVAITNNSTNTPTGSFEVDVNVPKFMTINYFDGGSCTANPCRFGNLAYWTVATLAPGASTQFQFTATVDNSVTYPPPSDGTVLLADARAFVFGGVSTSSAIVVDSTNHLNLGLSGAPNRVFPGANLTYTVSYGNTGTVAVPATMNLVLPSGTTFVSATGGGTLNGSTVQWPLGSLASGYADQRQVVVKVADAAVPGSLLVAQAQLVNTTTGRNLARESTTDLVAASSLLSLSLVGSPDPVAPGSTVVYKMTVANNSTNTPTGSFEIDVNIPKFMTFNYFDGGSCTANPCRYGNLAYWTIATLAPGASTVLQFTATVDNSVNYPPPSDGTVLYADARAFVFGGVATTSALLVNSLSHVNLSVSGTPSRVAPGAALTYTLNAGNPGSGAVPATLSMPLPVGTSFVSATSGGTYSSGLIEWTLGSITAGLIQQRQAVVTVDPAAIPGALVVGSAQLLDPTTRRTLVRESATNLVANDALLSMSMSETPNPVAPGGTMVYSLTLTNNSTNTPTGSFEVDVVPPRFAAVSQYGGGSCTANPCRYGNLLYWTVASIAAGGSTTLTFSVLVDNTVNNPAPPNGTVLTAGATAFIFGGVQTSVSTYVGGLPVLSGGGGSGGSGAGGNSSVGGSTSSGGSTSVGGSSSVGGSTSSGGSSSVGGSTSFGGGTSSSGGTGGASSLGGTDSGGSNTTSGGNGADAGSPEAGGGPIGDGELAGAGGEAGISGVEEAGAPSQGGGTGAGKAGGSSVSTGGGDSTATGGGSSGSSSSGSSSKSGGCSFGPTGQAPSKPAWAALALLGLAYAARKRRNQRAQA
jgi:MYXO-CTERM domain-containing protein/uncharacterized repeat protein (TIGR01451 family)